MSKVIVYIPDMVPSEDVANALAGMSVSFRNSQFFSAHDKEQADAVVIADKVANAKDIAAAYDNVVSLAEFLEKGVPKKVEKVFNPDAPLEAKAAKAKAAK